MKNFTKISFGFFLLVLIKASEAKPPENPQINDPLFQPLDVEQVLCHSAPLVFVGTYKGIEEKDYFMYALAPDKVLKHTFKQWHDLGSFSVERILRNKKGVSTLDNNATNLDEEEILKGLTVEVEGRSTGGGVGFDLTPDKGKEGIWIIAGSNPFTGVLMLYPHPDNPLPKGDLASVEKILRTCQ